VLAAPTSPMWQGCAEMTRPHAGRIYLVGRRGELLGTVEAPEEMAASAAAMEEFGITGEQQARLAAQRSR
jgi:lipopolysaccharide/colanic/teichoic acid biosynthesis glycosyltransferase